MPLSLVLDDLGTEPSAYDATGLRKFLSAPLYPSLRILAIPLKNFDMPLISFICGFFIWEGSFQLKTYMLSLGVFRQARSPREVYPPPAPFASANPIEDLKALLENPNRQTDTCNERSANRRVSNGALTTWRKNDAELQLS